MCAIHWDIRSGKIMLYNLISKIWYSGLNKFELDEVMFHVHNKQVIKPSLRVKKRERLCRTEHGVAAY